MTSICAPALIYLAFSLTQIIIDTFKGYYNTAFFKVIVMIIITILLNTLCQGGMTIISWIIVFVPFMFMSLIVGILLYVFGLDAATGKFNKCDDLFPLRAVRVCKVKFFKKVRTAIKIYCGRRKNCR